MYASSSHAFLHCSELEDEGLPYDDEPSAAAPQVSPEPVAPAMSPPAMQREDTFKFSTRWFFRTARAFHIGLAQVCVSTAAAVCSLRVFSWPTSCAH